MNNEELKIFGQPNTFGYSKKQTGLALLCNTRENEYILTSFSPDLTMKN